MKLMDVQESIQSMYRNSGKKVKKKKVQKLL